MYVNVPKLEGKMKEAQLSVTDIALKMGIDKTTLYRKLKNGGAGLTVRDANLLVEILSLSLEEAAAIFFAQRVA